MQFSEFADLQKKKSTIVKKVLQVRDSRVFFKENELIIDTIFKGKIGSRTILS